MGYLSIVLLKYLPWITSETLAPAEEEIEVKDKSILEKVNLIEELDTEEKNMVFKLIDTFLTKKKLKDFFQKNMATL